MLLVISKDKKYAQNAVNIFYNMGIVACAEAPSEALSEICISYRGVLVISPELIPDLQNYMRRLRLYAADTPIFAVSNGTYDKALFDGSYTGTDSSSKILSAFSEYSARSGRCGIGIYTAAAIDASADLECVTVLGNEIKLTKTEKMILRYLIRSYPSPKKPTDIIKYSFRHGRAPLESSIRTHISKMNSKFRAITGEGVITSREGEGYLILTPESEKNIHTYEKTEITV